MNRKGYLLKLTALVLSIILLLPAMPVFAEPAQVVDPEAVLFDYDVVYSGPFNHQVKYLEDIVITLNGVAKVKAKSLPLMPEPQWVNIESPLYLEWSATTPSQLTSLGISFSGNTITVPPTANAGALGITAKIKMVVPLTQTVMTLYTENFTFNFSKRIPIVSFVNGVQDFSLSVPYQDNEVNIDYTAVVKDQSGDVISELTPKVRLISATSLPVHGYYNDTTDHLKLNGQPGYAGEIVLEAYIQEFDSPLPTGVNTAALAPLNPVHSVQKTIVISREEDEPAYGVLKGKARIAIPRTGEIKEIYTYKIYSQFDVLLEDYGHIADFYFPGNQPATVKVDHEAQTVEVTVKNSAPHSYIILKARLYDEEVLADAELEEQPALKELEFGWEGYNQMYIYLDKKVYGTFDDAKNVIVLDTTIATGEIPAEGLVTQKIYENLQFRIINHSPDVQPVALNGQDLLWRDYNPETPQIFPGKMDVEFRYKNNYRWTSMVPQDLDIECKPKSYLPGEILPFSFTVLKPTIGVTPVAPAIGANANVTISYNELYPALELVPGDSQELLWNDPDDKPYIAFKSMWYKIGDVGLWTRYENPFTVNTNTTIFAKTIVFLDIVDSFLQKALDNMYYPNFSGDYTSPIESKAIVFGQTTTQPPATTTQPPVTTAPPVTDAPVTQTPATQPITQAEVPTTTVAIFFPPIPFANVDEELPEVTVPLGNLDTTNATQESASDLVIVEVVTPLGDGTLPQTNELPIALLYGLGILVSGLGVYFVKRKEEE